MPISLPITFGPDLSREAISKTVKKRLHTGNYEGRKPGRTDFIRDGPRIRVSI